MKTVTILLIIVTSIVSGCGIHKEPPKPHDPIPVDTTQQDRYACAIEVVSKVPLPTVTGDNITIWIIAKQEAQKMRTDLFKICMQSKGQ